MTVPPPLPPNPPLAIKFITWGSTSRKMALVWLWSCVVLGAIFLLLASITPWALIGAIYFLLFAPWYWIGIRWMDRNNGRWPGFKL